MLRSTLPSDWPGRFWGKQEAEPCWIQVICVLQALEALDRALQQKPADVTVRAELHFSKGNQLREMNQLDRAFQSYKLAVELKPDQSQAWMNMGGIQHIKGDYAAARMYYQRALLLSPGSKLLMENLAKLDRLEKRLSGAT